MNVDKGLLKYILQIRWDLMVKDWCLQFVGELHLRDMSKRGYASHHYGKCVVDKHVGIPCAHGQFLRFDYDLSSCKLYTILRTTIERKDWRQKMVNEIIKHKTVSEVHFEQYQDLCFYYNNYKYMKIYHQSRANLFMSKDEYEKEVNKYFFLCRLD